MSALLDVNAELATLIPADIRDLFKDPPLLKTEDSGRYWALLRHFVKCLKPSDIFVWLWVRSLVDLNWEILRLRQFRAIVSDKAQSLYFEYAESLHDDEDEEAAAERARRFGPVESWISVPDAARYFVEGINRYQAMDRMIASAERRRDRILHEIDAHRRRIARRLCKELVDGECEEVPQAA